MLQILTFLNEHKEDFIATIGSAHIILMHGYYYVIKQGGIRTMWNNFMGPKTNSVEATTVKQETKQV